MSNIMTLKEWKQINTSSIASVVDVHYKNLDLHLVINHDDNICAVFYKNILLPMQLISDDTLDNLMDEVMELRGDLKYPTTFRW